MNREEMKVMSYLSDNLGDGGSILEMSKGIDRKYGPAYYPNIYNTVKGLEKRGIIHIEPEGNSRLIRLNMENPLSVYYISEVENYKNQRISMSKEVLSGILDLIQEFDIFSICALDAERYKKINRLELLVLTRNHGENKGLIKSLLKMESDYNIKVDPIILTLDEFIKIMKASELDLIKDLILNKNILYNSDGFWELIKQHGINARYEKFNKFPQDLTRDELAYNYSRFGYRLNENIKPNNKIAIEPIIFSMSISEEIRIKYGTIILFYKNIEKINWAYLYYIYKRYDNLGKLKGILLSLARLPNVQHNNEIEYYINLIPDKLNIYDSKLVKKYIELYD
ncbi:MAG: hypothetical protein M1465_00495 [Candidatus Marsarchaeota archaeon]|nr:hypothetical protein [Candidatus Marsarchaeota archaeon]